jgi:hypothetical protein
MERGLLLRLACVLAVGTLGARGSGAGEPEGTRTGVRVFTTSRGQPAPAQVVVTRAEVPNPHFAPRWSESCSGRPTMQAVRLQHRLGASTEPAMAPATVDATGAWFFDLAPGGYVAWAAGEGGVHGAASFEVEARGETLAVELPLSDGPHALQGEIQWADGAAFRGHVVLAGDREDAGARWPLARCPVDAKGHWSVAGLSQRKVWLVVVLPDGGSATSPRILVPSPAPVRWVLDAGAVAPVSGRVESTLDGKPIADAALEVTLDGTDGTRLVRTAHSAPDGSFSLSTRGKLKAIGASALGFRPDSAWPGDALILKLEPCRPQRGRLVTTAGEPVGAGVRVLAYGSDLGPYRHVGASTDAAGRFDLDDLRPGEWMVYAFGDGWVSTGLWNVSWKTYNPFLLQVGPMAGAEVVRQVVPAGRVEGRIVDDDGRPVAGARVRARLTGTPVVDERPLWAGCAEVTVASARDGSFLFRSLLPNGRYDFDVRHPGFADWVSEPVVASAPGQEPLTIAISSRRWLRVEVRDKVTGAPIEGAEVEPHILRSWGAEWLSYERVTGPDGVVGLGPLPLGDVAIQVDSPAHAHPEGEPTPVPEAFTGPDAAPWVVRLEPGRTLRGQVTFAEGTPTTGYVAVCYRNPATEHHETPVRSVVVDEKGGFTLTGLRARRYVVGVGPADSEARFGGYTMVEAGDATVAVQVGPVDEREEPTFERLPRPRSPQPEEPKPAPPTGELRGRVLDDAGQGLLGVRVSVIPGVAGRSVKPDRYEFQYSRHDAYTAADGRYRIAGLPEGEVDVCFAVPADLVRPDLERFTLTSEERVLRLRRGVRIAVTVMDPEGRPFAGARVEARRLEGEPDNEKWQIHSMAYTGRDGVAHLEGLALELDYRLAVYPDSELRLDLYDRQSYDWKPAPTTVALSKKETAPR